MLREIRKGAVVAALAALVGVMGMQPVQAQQDKPGIKVGFLKCNVASGFGFIFGSSKNLKCIFAPDTTGQPERYTGAIKKFGIDIGYTQSGVILWAVFAPTSNLDAGALQGGYIGATAEVTAVIGLGANVLVGGGNSIALQPVSISGQQGLNVAAGIGSVTLNWVR